MENNKLTFAVFGNTSQTKKSVSAHEVIDCIDSFGDNVLMESDYFSFLESCNMLGNKHIETFKDNLEHIDFVISIGGDGTFLNTVARIGGAKIPIIGVNTGRLGFLSDVKPGEFFSLMTSLHKGIYTLETRAVLEVIVDNKDSSAYRYALNDVAILKKDEASMITIHAEVDNIRLTTYLADGLVMSTPTGSTAYSLSIGGPIIVPGTRVFSLTAVAPHSLTMRPIIIPDSSVVSLTVESRSHSFLVAVDGRSESYPDASQITLRRAPFSVKIVKRSGSKYFDTLREKMMWGVDIRE